MAEPGRWVTLEVRVEREVANEEEEWKPTREQVAHQIQHRLEGIPLDTGWVIAKVEA